MTTKIVALTDALGNLVRFVLLPGQRFETVGVAPLIKDMEFAMVDGTIVKVHRHGQGAKGGLKISP